MGQTWLKLSVLYLVIGISVGLFMSITLQLNWAAGHAHVNVVGWLSTLGIGTVLSIYPHLAVNALGTATFWLYHIGVPLFLFSTFFVQVNPGVAHIFTFIGGPMFLLAIILFGVNLFMNLKDDDVAKYKRSM
ncbi:MAG: hypothetical protein ACTH14_00940 [Jeotgalicoccus sp.]